MSLLQSSPAHNPTSAPCTCSVTPNTSHGWLVLRTRPLVALGAVAAALGCKSEGRQFDPPTSVDEAVADAAAPSVDRNSDSSNGASSDGASTPAAPTDRVTVELTSETGSEPTTGNTTATASAETSAPSSETSTEEPTGETSTSEPNADDFGVGAPPNFGNLGSGEGRILVVNTFDQTSVDVWLAGNDQPSAEDIATETATLVAVTRGAQRVVLTRHGTRDVVGCSDWFPLRGSEQWAVVARGGEHTCVGSGDGSTLSFRQTQSLDDNPVRYVHATTPDSFSFIRNQQTEPGALNNGETLTGTSLLGCRSACMVRYELAATGIDASRHFSLTVNTVEEVPPLGEVMLLVLGNIRQEWPSEPDALRLLRVDLDGSTYPIRRDPELAFARIGDGIVTFSRRTPPTVSEIATVDPDCNGGACVLDAHQWWAGSTEFLVDAPEVSTEITVELEAGHRYVLLSTPDPLRPLYWLDADFDRSESNRAYIRGINLDSSGGPLSFGYVFGNAAVAIDTLSSIPWGEVSTGNGGSVPTEGGGWDLVTAETADGLRRDCFYSMETPRGFRGYLIAAELMQPLDITQWPPSLSATHMMCF